MNEKTAELLEVIRRTFMNRQARDRQIASIITNIRGRTATPEDVAAYAERLGEILSETLSDKLITSQTYGNNVKWLKTFSPEIGTAGADAHAKRFTEQYASGKEAFANAVKSETVEGMVGNFLRLNKLPSDKDSVIEFLQGTVDPMLKTVHGMVNDAGAQVQDAIDRANGRGLKSVKGAYPQERIDGLLEKLAEAAVGDSESKKTMETWLGEPVVNNVQAFYDEHVRANAEARYQIGLDPVIIRTAAPGCCKWCSSHAGVYDYEEVRETGSEPFRRHQFCRCTVTLRDKGFRIEAWGRKQWEADRKTLENRKGYGLDTGKRKPPTPEEFIRQEEEKALAKAAKSGIIKEPDIYIGRSVGAKAKNYRVTLPDGTYTELTENTLITNIQVIAGKGRKREIDAIDRLMERFPESTEEEWQKKKGFGYVDVDGESYKVELHWFEEHTHDIIYDMKVKPDQSGNWYYDDSK